MIRGTVTADDLAGAARAALGAGRRLAGVDRLRGGTNKGVYRLSFDDGSTAIAYIWAEEENYWPDGRTAGTVNLTDPFSPASGIDLFMAAQRRLDDLGVRTPRVYLTDRSHRLYPADIAVVEDVPGENLETRLQRDPRGAEPAMARLARALDAMLRCTAPGFGKVAGIDSGGVARGSSCEQVVLDRAVANLAEAASRDPRIAGVRDRLADMLPALAAAVPPRSEYGLIHGELGPDHVLVERNGEPVLIDIEGLMFFDVEWEHVFLRIRFGEHYRWLDRPGLDERRLRFYLLAMRLSLVAGPLRLLDGDFPDRDAMMAIAEQNLRQVLALSAR